MKLNIFLHNDYHCFVINDMYMYPIINKNFNHNSILINFLLVNKNFAFIYYYKNVFLY